MIPGLEGRIETNSGFVMYKQGWPWARLLSGYLPLAFLLDPEIWEYLATVNNPYFKSPTQEMLCVLTSIL